MKCAPVLKGWNKELRIVKTCRPTSQRASLAPSPTPTPLIMCEAADSTIQLACFLVFSLPQRFVLDLYHDDYYDPFLSIPASFSKQYNYQKCHNCLRLQSTPKIHSYLIWRHNRSLTHINYLLP